MGRGETLTGIAARYSVTPTDLKLWNNLAHGGVRIGQQLRITSDRAAGPGRARSASGKTAKAGGTKRWRGTLRSAASTRGSRTSRPAIWLGNHLGALRREALLLPASIAGRATAPEKGDAGKAEHERRDGSRGTVLARGRPPGFPRCTR